MVQRPDSDLGGEVTAWLARVPPRAGVRGAVWVTSPRSAGALVGWVLNVVDDIRKLSAIFSPYLVAVSLESSGSIK